MDPRREPARPEGRMCRSSPSGTGKIVRTGVRKLFVLPWAASHGSRLAKSKKKQASIVK